MLFQFKVQRPLQRDARKTAAGYGLAFFRAIIDHIRRQQLKSCMPPFQLLRKREAFVVQLTGPYTTILRRRRAIAKDFLQ